MKKLTCALLAVCLLAAAVPGLADGLDLSFVRENSNVLSIDVDTERDCAFVQSSLSSQERAFVHKYESDYRYSTTAFDILVVDYAETSVYPVFRLWVSYCADEYLYVDSVTFIFNGKSYTFSGIALDGNRTKDEKGVTEDLLIRFGTDNIEFPADLERYIDSVMGDEYDAEKLDANPVTMVLHGTEDVTVTLGSGFLTDFLLVKIAYVRCNGMSYLDKPLATPMETADAR